MWVMDVIGDLATERISPQKFNNNNYGVLYDVLRWHFSRGSDGNAKCSESETSSDGAKAENNAASDLEDFSIGPLGLARASRVGLSETFFNSSGPPKRSIQHKQAVLGFGSTM